MTREPVVDLRSDTVTRPTAAMRRAMADAAVGDDVFGEDPTVRALEGRAAEVLGKAAALFVASGTMANQIALLCHTRPGDEVVVGEGAHVAWYESGAGAAWAGVQFAVAGRGGTFDASDVEAATKPNAYYLPRTSLVAVENTHNRAGGRVFPADAIARIAAFCRTRGLGLHMDGARIWNAAAATGSSEAALVADADTVSACFSKGLGAPVGSVIAGPREVVERARRFRKMLGGGMRQAGVIAAGALHALDHHRARLRDDHANAAAIAATLATSEHVEIDRTSVETNIVIFDLRSVDGETFVARAAEQGVLAHAIGPRRIRLVTHLDVDRAMCERAAEVALRAALPS
ncbi:MAG: aminotransferase class I/II-fold pyridoxal phosphate-dependent enzyme [Deltaproteobacteria bacterium]|nr:aminotransferase class I/II-fold pyridoxal phosphate-dependent enzyme [Deltaproteobacteria bacterium]